MRWLYKTPPQPWLFTVFACIAGSASIWKVWKAKRKADNLRLGWTGEQAVGQYLDQEFASNAKVLHDILGKDFNIDHVLIHETGIYVIETKTRSKPIRGNAKLVYDGTTVLENGFPPDRNPIEQVRSARKWLTEELKKSTGRVFSVRAVVVYPGWWIDFTEKARLSDVWVLNPKMLPRRI